METRKLLREIHNYSFYFMALPERRLSGGRFPPLDFRYWPGRCLTQFQLLDARHRCLRSSSATSTATNHGVIPVRMRRGLLSTRHATFPEPCLTRLRQPIRYIGSHRLKQPITCLTPTCPMSSMNPYTYGRAFSSASALLRWVYCSRRVTSRPLELRALPREAFVMQVLIIGASKGDRLNDAPDA